MSTAPSPPVARALARYLLELLSRLERPDAAPRDAAWRAAVDGLTPVEREELRVWVTTLVLALAQRALPRA